MPARLKCKIEDVKIDKKKNIAILSVKVTVKGGSFYKAYRMNGDEKVSWDGFISRLRADLLQDERVKNGIPSIDKNTKDIQNRVGEAFMLDL